MEEKQVSDRVNLTKMNFGDLQSRDGLLSLNTFLLDKSYLAGYRPTQGDVVVFEAIKQVPPTDLENARRWYTHISSFDDAERQKFEGQSQSIDEDTEQKHELQSLSAKTADTKGLKPTTVITDDDVDTDIDLFGDDDEEESELTKQRLAAYREKKAARPTVVAKSEIVLDVKPWDDETNMEELEKNVRSIELDGLLWGASRLVPLAYGIKTLHITCVVEDDKIGTDLLEERITAFKDHAQSVDIAAFRKI